MDLKGKAVLITGGRRVGGALALMLAGRGADLALTYRTSRRAIEATADEVEARGVGSMFIGADLSDADRAGAAVDRVGVGEVGPGRRRLEAKPQSGHKKRARDSLCNPP